MQLGTSTIPLLPAVGVGAAVVLAGLVLWGVHRARTASRTPRDVTRYDDHDEPQERDWTGEGAGGAADPPPPARPLTVADVVAARGADTQPMPTVATGSSGRGPGPTVVHDPLRGLSLDPGATAAVTGQGRRPGPPPAAGTPAARRAGVGLHRLADEEPHGPQPTDPPAAPVGPARHAGLAGPAEDTDGAVELDDDGDVVPVAGPAAPDDRTAPTDADEPVSGIAGDAAGDAPEAIPPESPEDRSPGEPRAAQAVDAPASGGTPDPADARPETAPPGDDGAVAPDVRTTWNGLTPAASASGPAAVVPDLDEDSDAPEPVGTGPVPPPWSPARAASAGPPDHDAGSPEPVSFAVAQALAARAVRRAQGRPDVPDLAADDVPTPLPDARDRLLSVLLTDPVTALGATTELDDTRARIDHLGDVLRRRRADLATAVHRLHASGLTGEQIGQLAGMDGADVREILEQASGEGSGGR